MYADSVDPAGTRDRIRVVVVADMRFYRDTLTSGLGSCEQLALVGAASDGPQAVSLLPAASPHIVVLDMATRDSLKIVRAISAAAPAVKVIAFGVDEVDREILACAEAGVAGYVPCDASLESLVGTIESVARGELLCSARIAGILLHRVASLASGAATRAPQPPLTSREREVAALLNRGLSNKEIARLLSVEVTTVKNHVHHILEKLAVATRAQAAAQLRGHLPARVPRSTLGEHSGSPPG